MKAKNVLSVAMTAGIAISPMLTEAKITDPVCDAANEINIDNLHTATDIKRALGIDEQVSPLKVINCVNETAEYSHHLAFPPSQLATMLISKLKKCLGPQHPMASVIQYCFGDTKSNSAFAPDCNEKLEDANIISRNVSIILQMAKDEVAKSKATARHLANESAAKAKEVLKAHRERKGTQK